MQKYVKMTEEEYNDLLTQTPSAMLQQTSDNYKQKLDAAYKQISELEAALSNYIIGGAKPREPEPKKEKIKRKKVSNKKRWTPKEDKVITSAVDSIYTVTGFNKGNVLLPGRSHQAICDRARTLGFRIKNDYIRSK